MGAVSQFGGRPFKRYYQTWHWQGLLYKLDVVVPLITDPPQTSWITFLFFSSPPFDLLICLFKKCFLFKKKNQVMLSIPSLYYISICCVSCILFVSVCIYNLIIIISFSDKVLTFSFFPNISPNYFILNIENTRCMLKINAIFALCV